MKYKGKYRLMAEIDQNTNDFPRDETGKIEENDVYIQCSKNCKVYHYGKSILVAYIPSLGRGHNILLSIAKDKLGIEDRIDYEELYRKLEKENTVFDIVENDSEIEFKFNAKNIEYIMQYLNPKTSGRNISPFSTRNLPKSDYKIPDEDLAAYNKIMAEKYSERFLDIRYITNNFLKSISNKQCNEEKIKADMKLKCMKPKQYIHFIGKWDEYLKALNEG